MPRVLQGLAIIDLHNSLSFELLIASNVDRNIHFPILDTVLTVVFLCPVSSYFPTNKQLFHFVLSHNRGSPNLVHMKIREEPEGQRSRWRRKKMGEACNDGEHSDCDTMSMVLGHCVEQPRSDCARLSAARHMRRAV